MRFLLLIGLLLSFSFQAKTWNENDCCRIPAVESEDLSYNWDGSDTTNVWAIDMTVLKVKDEYYAVWSGWDKFYREKESGVQALYIARMTFHDEKPYVRLGPRVLLSEPDLDWELKDKEHLSLQEGPSALYHGDDVFILYSTRASWLEHYKMGQLRLKSVDNDPLDPSSWEKKPVPVFKGVTKEDGLGYEAYGVGHASFTMSPDDTEYWINYHSKTQLKPGWGDRMVFFQKFDFDENGDPYFGPAANPALPLQRPSGEVEIELSSAEGEPSATFTNPVYGGADPWIMKHDGKYYTCHSGSGSIWVTESRFMTKFEDGQTRNEARRRVWGLNDPESGKWNVKSLWAPEIHFIEGKWYIFYTAGKEKSGPFWNQKAGVLVSEDGPFGPYIEHDDAPLFTGDGK